MNLQPYHDQFNTNQNDAIYLNHAAVSPLSRRCATAMQQAIEWNCDLTPENWIKFIGRLQYCREAIARMLNVEPGDVALSRNTTEGINWVANGLDWRKGDRIVTVEGEYPANIYPWMRLEEEKGIELVRIQPQDARVPLEFIEQQLTPGTRLLSISFVEFSTGFRFDLEEVGRLCKEKGVLFLVDFIQGMGVFPLDLSKYNIDFAAGGAQKWLLGPQGAGFFYCPKASLDLLKVTTVGATSIVNWEPYAQYDFSLREDASRFEYGTPPTLPLIGLEASIEMLLEAGMENVRDQVKLLTDVLIDGATSKNYRCHSPRGEGEWSGIVILSHPNNSPKSVVEALQSAGITAAEREGRIRLAPHFYQTEAQIQRVIDALP